MSFSHRELANAIRFLSIDAVQKANSGHPGAPMGMADIAETLWRSFLKHNPKNPYWVNRDRFVLSNGHASMLLYSLLHLTGYALSTDDLKQFRQLHSKTPGHPEFGYAPGVETTTGPLGQGLANAVGMAIAEKTFAAQFNREKFNIIDHFTYVFLGDGCLMEGISHEAFSLAGTLKLGKLIAFYDDNGISIDGNVEGWFTDDTAKRFESYHWHVIRDIDGHNHDAVEKAIKEAQAETEKPTIIICKTTIGFGSPTKAGTAATHGSPLGDEEIAATRKALNWSYAPFEIPKEMYTEWDAKPLGAQIENEWNKLFVEYKNAYPECAKEFERRIMRKLPQNWQVDSEKFIANLQENPANISTRVASQKSIEEFAKFLPEFLGGSADLAPSNLTMWSNSIPLNEKSSGNYIHYGVREFGMSAIMNGIALYGGFIPFGATFLMFVEYARNAIRMAALMKINPIFVYTHDSIGLGEDGPTHQAVEQLSGLRLTPNLNVWRPCDQVETAVSWKHAIESQRTPNVLIFTRQNLVQQNRNSQQIENINKGAYILIDSNDKPELILIATGSEVNLAVEAHKKLTEKGRKVRVISMPSMFTFEQQSEEYKEKLLPKSVTKRLAIEAGATAIWYKYVGLQGKVIGMDCFGESAPAEQLFKEFGFTVENVLEKSEQLLA